MSGRRAMPALVGPEERIARGVTCQFRSGAGGVDCVWDPDRPRRLEGQALRAYVGARTRFYKRLANAVGGNVLDADLAKSGFVARLVEPDPAGHA